MVVLFLLGGNLPGKFPMCMTNLHCQSLVSAFRSVLCISNLHTHFSILGHSVPFRNNLILNMVLFHTQKSHSAGTEVTPSFTYAWFLLLARFATKSPGSNLKKVELSGSCLYVRIICLRCDGESKCASWLYHVLCVCEEQFYSKVVMNAIVE